MEVIHVVQISGGKDSQMCAKLIRDRHPNSKIYAVFCDTKLEHPLTYDHVDKICNLYDLEKVVLNNGSVASEIKRWKRFPSGGARFCTQYLKIEPSKKYLIQLAIDNPDKQIINYIGIRSDESAARQKRYADIDDSLYMPHEIIPSKYPQYMGKKHGIRFCLPIINFTEKEVFNALGDDVNPLYKDFSNVGCFPCMAAGDKYKHKAFEYDETGREHYVIMKKLESVTNYPIFNTKIGKKLETEQPPCSFCSM